MIKKYAATIFIGIAVVWFLIDYARNGNIWELIFGIVGFIAWCAEAYDTFIARKGRKSDVMNGT